MDLVFAALSAEKQKVTALLEADPYGKPSFSRIGYKVKDGLAVGQDKDKFYVFMRVPDEFVPFVREKMKGVMEESKPEVIAAVSKAITEEENNAEAGFGSIFG